VLLPISTTVLSGEGQISVETTDTTKVADRIETGPGKVAVTGL
jgi:hypothetical protein